MRDAIPRAVAFMRQAGRCSPGEFDRALAISPAAGRRLRVRMRAAGLLAGNKATIYLTDAHNLPAPTHSASTPERAPRPLRQPKASNRTSATPPRSPPPTLPQTLEAGTPAAAPRHRPLLDTLAELIGGETLEPELHRQAVLNAAATRRARSRGEPAALPLNMRVEQAPQPAAPSPGALIPGYYPGPPPWAPDEYGRPRVRKR
jgi:hypothetical protein